jgi:enamine deaminase RidA (YjgF/YER057c/UK114 family)
MTKQTIDPADAMFKTADGRSMFQAFGYSAAVRAGDFIYVSGQIGLNPDGTMPHDAEPQIVNAFERLKAVLAAAGAELSDIVELVSYHVGLQAQRAAFFEIKGRYIKEPYPAWTMLEVAGLARPGLLIEIKAIAHKK